MLWHDILFHYTQICSSIQHATCYDYLVEIATPGSQPTGTAAVRIVVPADI